MSMGKTTAGERGRSTVWTRTLQLETSSRKHSLEVAPITLAQSTQQTTI